MRKSMIASVLLCFTTISCGYRHSSQTQKEREQQADEAARKAGRAAYEAKEKAEEAAKQLGRDLESASENAQKGWNDAKQEHQAQKKTDQH